MTLISTKVPVSVLIPAKDEEENLPNCLSSLARADEIFLVDSQSSDRTLEIATSFGVEVVQFQFNGSWPKKKNWSLDNLPFRNEWVLIVDCDERIPETLWDEIAEAIKNPNLDGYYINRRVYFLGRWLRHGGRYPDWNLRLFRHEQGRYENLCTETIPNTGDNEIHEHVILKGQVGYLKTDMLHIDFRNLFHWLERHNRYSNWEAKVYYNLLHGMDDRGTIGGDLLGSAVQRKRFFKKIWVRLPLKPFLRFVVFYILKLGFLDGKAGFIYARLLSQYEYQIAVKLYELEQMEGRLNVTSANPKSIKRISWRKKLPIYRAYALLSARSLFHRP